MGKVRDRERAAERLSPRQDTIIEPQARKNDGIPICLKPRGRIGVLFLEWSGFGNQKVVIDWTVVDGPKAAQAFGDRLLESPRSFADRTSISGGIDAAVSQLARAPFEAQRRTIDVSGDGTITLTHYHRNEDRCNSTATFSSSMRNRRPTASSNNCATT